MRSFEEKLPNHGDPTWQIGFPRSLLAFWDLLEAVLFSKRYAESVLAGIRAHRSAADILESDEFRKDLDAIAAGAKGEQEEGAAAMTAQTEPSSSGGRSRNHDNPIELELTSPSIVAATAACLNASIQVLSFYVTKAEKSSNGRSSLWRCRRRETSAKASSKPM